MIGPKTTLILQRLSTTDDGGGGFTETWTEIHRFTGTLTSVSGDERYVRYADAPYGNHYFYIDYPKNPSITITEKDRFLSVDGTREFQIKYVEPPAATKRFLLIHLKEDITIT